jgi:hypothetical protein
MMRVLLLDGSLQPEAGSICLVTSTDRALDQLTLPRPEDHINGFC